MTDRRKLEKYLIIGVIALFVVISATYAFFQAQLQSGAQTDVNIGSNTTDSLTFDVNNAINLNINQFNFGVGAGNLSSSATASATLLANNSSNTATYTYYVYFKINSNEFTYTTSDSKPEIILTVTDPTGQPVTSIDGLTYVQNIQTTTSDGSTQTVSGFDITTATGTFAVASAYSITANSTTPTTQNWEFTATFINLDSDQQGNTGKSMDAEILIQQEELKSDTLAEYITTQVYTGTDGENDLYYHDGVGTYTNANQEAGDNSYRYSGANPNNYVCFGSDEETCPNDNLYRIIGVFDGQVKLIKSARYTNGSWIWDDTEPDYQFGNNTWNETTKPDIYTTLNTTYWNTLGSNWQGLIDQDHIWEVGGMFYSETNTAKQYYDNEVGVNQSGYEETMAIGLMYVSDYGFGADSSKWTTGLGYPDGENYGTGNWLYIGLPEWLISRCTDNPSYAFVVYFNYGGVVNYSYVLNASMVRPSFYLESSVQYVSGSGSQTDPYRIS